MPQDRSAGDVYRSYNEVENAHDHVAMTRLLAEDIEIVVNGKPAISSAKGDRLAMSALFDAYPDYRREVLAVVEAGDTAAVRWRMLGTPAGTYQDRLDSLDLEGCSVVEVAEGRIRRAWLYSAPGPIEAILELAKDQAEDGEPG